MAVELSPYLTKSTEKTLSDASWDSFYAHTTYNFTRFILLSSALGLIFISGAINPVYGVITALSLYQEKTVKLIDSLCLSSLDEKRKTTARVHEVAQKVFERSQAIRLDSPLNIKRKINDFGIDIERLPYYRNFEAIYGDRTYTQLKPVIAQVETWNNEVYAAKEDIRVVTEEANELVRSLEDAPMNDEHIATLAKIASKRKEAYDIEKSRLLPARLRAAYFLHILSDVHEVRSFNTLGKVIPMNYQMRSLVAEALGIPREATREHALAHDTFFITNSGRKLSRDEVLRMPLKDLGTVLFS